jgi:hypothetical protein
MVKKTRSNQTSRKSAKTPRSSKTSKVRRTKTPRSSNRKGSKEHRGKIAVQIIKEQTKQLEKSIERITKEMERASDKGYEKLMTKAKEIWKNEFGEDLKEPMLSQFVMSFLNQKMETESVRLLKKQLGIQQVQQGGNMGNIEGPYPSAYYPNFINAQQVYDHPIPSIGSCGGSLEGGKRKRNMTRRNKGKGKKRNTRRNKANRKLKRGVLQRGGGYNPFPISLPNYFPATISQSYSPPGTDVLAGPSSFIRGYFDVLNGSQVVNMDPATTGSLGDASNSILNTPNFATDINYSPM